MVSTVDMLCTSLVAMQVNEADKPQYQNGVTHHYAVGLGHHDEGIVRIGQAIRANFKCGNVFYQDVSGWDIGIPPSPLVMAGQSRALTLCINREPGMAYFAMVDRFVCCQE